MLNRLSAFIERLKQRLLIVIEKLEKKQAELNEIVKLKDIEIEKLRQEIKRNRT